MRGILVKPLVLDSGPDIVVMPAGTQVNIESSDDWYHDVQNADIDEAIDLMKES